MSTLKFLLAVTVEDVFVPPLGMLRVTTDLKLVPASELGIPPKGCCSPSPSPDTSPTPPKMVPTRTHSTRRSSQRS